MEIEEIRDHKNKEISSGDRERADEASDLIMDNGGVLRADLRPEKLKREEISEGRRNRRNGEDIWADKREHYPTVSWRIQHSQGFYAEEWSEDKQEEDDWQAPDKLQRTSNMVFCNGVQEIPPIKDRVLSSPCVQHQGGGCSIFHVSGHMCYYVEDRNPNPS